MTHASRIVISLGGSIVVPDGIDSLFVSSFKKMIETYVTAGKTFYIIVGGGRPARTYQLGLHDAGTTDQSALDWIGIAATRFNAEFLKQVFGSLAHTEIISDPTVLPQTSAPVIIGCGWKPGWSTDYDAVLVADGLGSKTVLNLSNIEYVYNADPRTNPDAEKFEQLTWTQYRSFIPAEWKPGFSAPFDPIASRYADEHGIEVIIMNGKNIDNLKSYLDGGAFLGTRIE